MPPQTAAEMLAAAWPPLRTYCPILQTVSAQQAAFLSLDCTEALYGGAVGGGKTGALLMAALQYVHIPDYAALILRRTFPELEQPDGPIDQSLRWFASVPESLRPVYNRGDHEWRFPSGAVLKFGHLDHPNAMIRYQGGGYHFFGFDELTHFDEQPYEFIGFSRTRRPREGPLSRVPMRVRATANPGGPGHMWVKQRFITGRKPGVMFVPAKLEHNPGIDFDDYVSRLSELGPELRQQLLDGDWDAIEHAAFEIRDVHMVDGFEPGDGMEKFEGADWGLNGAPWALWTVDFEENVVGTDLLYVHDTLPSDFCSDHLIPRRKASWGFDNRAFVDPSIWQRTSTKNRWGQPAMLADEFTDNGVNVERANNDPRAGLIRIREMLKPDPEHPFPDWHPRRGEMGAPRVFFVRGVFDPVVEELRAAPLQPIDKRDGGEMVDPKWESRVGHCVAMCRYSLMTRPAPSERPYVPLEDPRDEFARKVRAEREKPPRRTYQHV